MQYGVLTCLASLQILYESGTVIHGRPYPLAGSSYSNLFLHFEPVGFSESHYNGADRRRKDAKVMFEEALAEHHKNSKTQEQGKQKEKLRPHYVHSSNDERWNQKYVYVKKTTTVKRPKIEIKRTEQFADEDRLFHNLAAKGMLTRMKEMVVSTAILFFRSCT